jgi:hypothetical protein
MLKKLRKVSFPKGDGRCFLWKPVKHAATAFRGPGNHRITDQDPRDLQDAWLAACSRFNILATTQCLAREVSCRITT